MKKCTKCNKEKEYKYFSFRSDTQKYRNKCRQCAKGYKTLRSDKQGRIGKLLEEGKKECGKCKDVKPIDEFSSDKYTTTGLTSWCKKCKKGYQVENAEAIKRTRAKSIYGICDNKYDELVKINNCQICNKEVQGNHRHIDHCHTTGVVRGLLCRKCNLGLGHFRDNEVYLRNAIEYLNKFK